MIAKTKEEIENLRTSGRMLAEVLKEVALLVKPGVTTATLDLAAQAGIESRGCKSAFFGYTPEGAPHPYPATLCVTVNDEVVHGIPSESRLLKEGDLVMLDLGLSYNGYFTDAAITVCVRTCDEAAKRLMEATRKALDAGIKEARAGNRIGDIGAAIEAVAKEYGYGLAEDLGGHAIGKKPHEKPFIANIGPKGSGEKIVEGMVLALEPIFTEGNGKIILDSDEWTYRTEDGSRSVEFEKTILVTKDTAEILTVL
ncbi:type I methionyl aminopeptidase [Acetobacteraceae bacterium]|nr:type I methionyl aminopeptidase [Candidatus Parcubacteria bacterium]